MLKTTAVYLSKDSRTIHIYTSGDDSYAEHIPGEGADICLFRSRETGKVTGVKLETHLEGVQLCCGDISLSVGVKTEGPDTDFAGYLEAAIFQTKAKDLIDNIFKNWDNKANDVRSLRDLLDEYEQKNRLDPSQSQPEPAS